MMDTRRSALVWSPPFGKWAAWITRPTASNVVCTLCGGASPLPLAGSRQRITKTQSGVYVDSEKNARTELSLDSCVVSYGDSLYIPPDIVAICSTSAGAISSLAVEYCRGSRRHPYMARGSRFVQNLITASKRAQMLRAGMLVRRFRTSVPKTSQSSWTPLLELLSVQSGLMMTAQNRQTRESPSDSRVVVQATPPFPSLSQPVGG